MFLPVPAGLLELWLWSVYLLNMLGDRTGDGNAPDISHDEATDLLSVEEAARRLRIGRTTMYSLISTGAIETVTIGRRRLVPPECVTAYVAALRTASQPASTAA